MIVFIPRQDELHTLAAGMLKDNTPDSAIVSSLQDKGVNGYYAELILSDVKTDIEDKRQLRKLILNGGFVFLAGLAITTLTFLIARTGIYFIFPMMLLAVLTSIMCSVSVLKT